jgi:predicted AlkP superfamily phosphohydrolase/phosphomutase
MPKVVVIGFDAMDADLIRDLTDAGRAPAFRALWETAAWAPTVAPVGFELGAVWPTIWTGVWPSRHARYSTEQIATGTYLLCPTGVDDLDRTPFWATAGAAGRRTFVLDAPLMPVRALADCVQVGEWGGHDRMFAAMSSPPSALADVERTVGRYGVGDECDAYGARHAWEELRDDLRVGAAQKTAATQALIADAEWDLVISVYAESHCAGHQLWPAHRALLDDVYETLDRGLATLLDAVGPDTTVVVLCSHGIANPYGGDHLLAGVLRRLDDAYGPPGRAVELRERALRQTARRRQVSRLRRRYPVDPQRWTATALDGARRFFRVPTVGLHSYIRFNLRGREPRGRVRPGSELDALVERLRADLLDLVDPDTGAPLVRQVHRTSDMYRGERIDDLPDLLVEWDERATGTAAASDLVGTVRAARWPGRPGEHRGAGVCFVRGPGIPAGRLGRDVQAVDVAPTVLGLLGVDPGDVDGRAFVGPSSS